MSDAAISSAKIRLDRKFVLTHGNAIYGVAFSPDGKRIATASLDNTVKLWNVVDGQHAATLKGHGDGVAYVGHLADGRIVTASLDKSLKIWPAEGGTATATMGSHQEYLACAAVARNGTMLVSGGFDKTVRLWDPATNSAAGVLTGHEANVQAVAITSDGKLVASAGDDRSIRLWNVETKSLLQTISGHSQTIEGLAFSQDDKQLASASADGTIRVWTSGGDPVLSIEVPGRRCKSVCFSPNGLWLAGGTFEGSVHLWKVTDRSELCSAKAHKNSIYGITFDASNKHLATASFDRTCQVWLVTELDQAK